MSVHLKAHDILAEIYDREIKEAVEQYQTAAKEWDAHPKDNYFYIDEDGVMRFGKISEE